MWIDLGTTDLEASKNFYGRLFGWDFEDLGPEAGGYNFIRSNGKMVGGIGSAQDPTQGTVWAVMFDTANADETLAKVEAAGGKVITPPMDVMGSGRMAVFTDTAGALFSVWQPITHSGTEVMHEHGTFTWAELSTPDVEGAKTFYTSVLPVTTSDFDLGDGMSYAVFSVGGQSVAGAMINPNVAPSWGIYFAVDDTDEAADKAIELGAAELMRDNAPPGRLAMFIDPQGAPFAIIKNDPNFSM